MFIDTHCHLNMIVKEEINVPISQNQLLLVDPVLKEAKEQKVDKILTIGTNLIESINSIEIAKEYENVFSVVGLHPCDCTQDWGEDFSKIKELVENRKHNKIVAIGETGLDFYHEPFHRGRQLSSFEAHIEFALECDLPLVVHVRESSDEILQVLEKYKKEVKGVIHCFSQDKSFADTVLEWGLYLGINAPLTYPKNEELRELIATIPLEKILLETDAPFLPPQQFRGKQNRPAYVPIIAQAIANAKKIDVSEVERVTTENAQKLFGI